MNNAPQLIFASRLAQARRMCGLSLRRLSEQLDGYVTYAALHKYEQGLMLPGSDVVLRLADALRQNIDFFFRPVSVSLEHIEFRKRAKFTKKQQDGLREQAADFFERYLELEEHLGLASHFEPPLPQVVIRKPADIEAAAAQLRDVWQLGRDAIPNVIELLEEHEVKVFEIDCSESLDGCAGWAGDVPVMVLNRSFPVDRRRLTALHELAHLVLKFAAKFEAAEVERLCHSFASAVLIPDSVMRSQFGENRSVISLNELCDLKANYGISIAAIMARARSLGLISEARYERFFKECAKRGWRKHEPGEYSGLERSTRFDQLLFRAVATEAVSLSKAATLSGKSLEALRKELQLLP